MAVRKRRESESSLWIVAAVFGIAAIGVLGWLLFKSIGADQQQHQARLAALRAVGSLDVDLNRAFTRTLGSTAAEQKQEAERINEKVGTALRSLDTGGGSLRGLSPEIDAALDAFFDTVETKFRKGADFENDNAAINTRISFKLGELLPFYDSLLREASGERQGSVQGVLRELNAALLVRLATDTQTAQDDVKLRLAQLQGLRQTEGYATVLTKLRANIDSLLLDRAEQADKLRAIVNLPTGTQLANVEQLYQTWYRSRGQEADQYRLILAGYTAFLLLVLGYLGLRLRESYSSLDKANARLTDANQTLESQVATRTKELTNSLSELRESQAQLVQSEKMASLGQMVAGVAHEINTPLGYARANAEIVRTSLGDIRQLCASQGKALSLLSANDSSEADIAGAIAEAEQRRQDTNPDELMGDLDNLLGDTDHGLVQIADLVSSLKDFSRVDRSRTDLFDLNAGVDSALKICNSQLKGRIEVLRHFSKLPEVECSPSQINQVFLNLINNAGQAIEGPGVITIQTAADKNGVIVKVSDTGSGMSPEVQKRIFEPFFTTKPVGKGTGLGLSIVFRIIEEHHGRIAVESTPGKGTSFTVQLPLRQPAAAAALAA